MKALFNIFIISILLSSACVNKTPKESSTSADSSSKSVGNPPEFKNPQVAEVYQEYINLKHALVKSDPKEAKVFAGKLSTALSEAAKPDASTIANIISSSTDITLQRNNFDQLTTEVESFIKSSGLKSGKIYKQYCPMAMEGKGGFWLASEANIQNPYYGDEMLTCGEVKEEIK